MTGRPRYLAGWGRFAARALAGAEGAVVATFERSLYVESAHGLACLGAVGDGPLNARCAPLDVPVGTTVRRCGTVIAIGPYALETAGAAAWRPPPAPLRLAVAAVAALAAPEDGLGAVAVALARGESLPLATPLLRHAAPAIEALRRRDAAGAARLLGLGPGLTPSGDDLIAGCLVARPDPDFAATLLADARRRTSRISAAHLQAAAAGEGGAALHEALAGGELAPLLALGHSSGWDMLAGALVALTSPP